MCISHHAISRSTDYPANSLPDALAGEIFPLLRSQPKLLQASDTNAFFGALCALFGVWRAIFPVFSRGAGNPASSPRADSTNFARAQKGPPLAGAALFVVTPLAAQLCQRNCCGFLADPCDNTMLTSAGPRWFIASSRAPRMCFGSSTKKPLSPKASMTRS
jgi:hypothetical protein